MWLDILYLHHQLDADFDDDDKFLDDSDDDSKDDGSKTRVNKAPLMSALNLLSNSVLILNPP